MTLLTRASDTTKRGNKPAWLAAVVLLGTYVVAVALDRGSPRGRLPALPERGWPFWQRVLVRTYHELNDDRLPALAAGVVFYGLLALFPALTALVSSYALFAKPSTISGHLAALSSVMPPSAVQIVDEQVTRIVASTTGQVSVAFVFGLAMAIWSANAGVKAIIDALNIVYGVKERRGMIALNLLSLALTVAVIVGLLLAIAAIVVLPIVLSYLRLGEAVVSWLRWPGLLLLLLLGLAVLYRFGPDLERPRWHWISPGAVFASLAWLAGSALLSWYLGHFADYDATYGSLGAGIALMMWLWMTATVVLVGAEFNSEIDAAMGLLKEPEHKIGDT